MTGGAGFIGRHLVARLLQDNLQITVIDDLSSSKLPEFPKGVRFYNEDIRARDSVADIFRKEKIDTCVHLAAVVGVGESISNPARAIDVNVNGTLSVLEACSKNNVRNLVFASSAAVYGNPKRLPLDENHVSDPISPYGASKVAGEALIAAYKHSGKLLNAVSLRFFNVYGEGQNPEYAGVITKFKDRLVKGLAPVIYGDGEQTRDFIFVGDVVESIVLAAKSDRYGVFNIGTGRPTSIIELAAKMIKIFGYNDMKPIGEKAATGQILHSYAEVKSVKSALGFEAKNELETTLKRVVESDIHHARPKAS